MSDDLKTRLEKQLTAYEKARVAAAAAAQAQETRNQEFRTQFAELAKTVLEPKLAVVLEVLLTRDCAALIHASASYIGLHCSKDVREMQSLPDNPMFRIGFLAHRGKVVFVANRTPHGATEARQSFDPGDLSPAKVESFILESVKAWFPAAG